MYPDDVTDGATAEDRDAAVAGACILLQGARAFEAVALTRAITDSSPDFKPASEVGRKAALSGNGRAWQAQYDEYCRVPGPRLGDAITALAPPGVDPKTQRWPTFAQPVLFLAAGTTVEEGSNGRRAGLQRHAVQQPAAAGRRLRGLLARHAVRERAVGGGANQRHVWCAERVMRRLASWNLDATAR